MPGPLGVGGQGGHLGLGPYCPFGVSASTRPAFRPDCPPPRVRDSFGEGVVRLERGPGLGSAVEAGDAPARPPGPPAVRGVRVEAVGVPLRVGGVQLPGVTGG